MCGYPMIYVGVLEYLHGQQPFENILEDVLDIFGLPPGPRLMVVMGHMLWAIQWAVHEYSNELVNLVWSWFHAVFRTYLFFVKFLLFSVRFLFLLGTSPERRHESIVRDFILIG